MKKWMVFMLAIALLVGCSEEKEVNQKDYVDEQTSSEKAEPVEEEKVEEPEDKTKIPGIGELEEIFIGYNEEIKLDGSDAELQPITMGPMKFFIENANIIDVVPDEDGKALYFEGEEKVRTFMMGVTIENTSDEDIVFNPPSAVITTDTGEQVEGGFYWGDAGGDFYGKVKKEGLIVWPLKNLDGEIKKVTMIIPAPYELESWDDKGGEKRIEFEMIPNDEYVKKYGDGE